MREFNVLAIFAVISYVGASHLSAADNAPEPILRIETGGHSSFVTSLAWEPSGRELWSAGWDKVVRVWRLNEQGNFDAKPDETVRLPIGPGRNGNIDALAFSSDGRWVAIGGYSNMVARAASFRDQAIETPISTVELREQGVIYVLDRNDNSFRRLEGHLGPVRRLEFVQCADGSEQLVSVGFDRNAQQVQIGSIRTWNVISGKQIASVQLPDLLPEPSPYRPSLAAMAATGAGVNVLAASGSGKMFHWKSADRLPSPPLSDGLFNSLAKPIPRPQWIVTASGNTAQRAGSIAFWNLDASGLPQRDSSRQISFPEQAGEKFLPLAVSLMSTRPAAATDLIAAVLCVFDSNWTPNHFQLRLLTVPQPGAPSREIMRQDLWKTVPGDPFPELVSNNSSAFLALAGHPDHEILIFKLADLLEKKFEPQRLVGQSTAPQTVEFVERQGELGLRIAERAADSAPAAKYVFNFAKNQIEEREPTAWKLSRAVGNEWSVARAAGNPRQLSVLQSGIIRQTMQVPASHSITDYVLSDSIKSTRAPLLIVAAQENGQPWLGVFDAQDGKLKRIFQGHTEPIISLALSGDSRLLATASKDQTIALWDLSDHDTLFKPRSILAGVALLQKEKSLEVERVEPGSAAATVFQGGDQLLGFFDKASPDQLQPWTKLVELYASIRTLKPGSPIKLRRQRAAQTADVMLTLEQAADVPKPLFQLMITKPNLDGNRRWIGWSPLGPFDASDRQMRQRLGWQLNVKQADRPVAFVPLEQYPELYTSGLLRDLITNLGKPIASVPITLVEPRMNLKVLRDRTDNWNEVGREGILRKPPQAVTLRITNPDFPTTVIQSLVLLVDGKAVGPFAPTALDGWQVDGTDLLTWSRGPHRLQAEMLTNETPTRKLLVETQFEFVPESPSLSITTVPAVTTKETQTALAAKVQLGSHGVGFETRLVRVEENGTKNTLRAWANETGEEQTIDFALELIEGRNRFELESTNAGADAAGTAALETVNLPIEVVRVPRDKNPPALSIVKLESLSELGTRPLTFVRNASLPMVVATDDLRITGKIVAEEKLVKANLNDVALPGFQSDSAAEFEFIAPVKLRPGRNTIRLVSKTEVSPEADLTFDILYQQPIPDIEILRPAANQLLSQLQLQPTAELQAVFQIVRGLRPLVVKAFINGQLLNQSIDVDLKNGTIKASLPLTLGSNTLVLELSNDTGVTARTTALTIYYQPSPTIAAREIPLEINAATYPVEVTGQSATPIDRVLLNGRELSRDQWTSEQTAGQFKLKMGAVPWQSEQRQSALMIFAQGSDKPALEMLAIPKRLSSVTPPTLVFLNPGDNSTTVAEEDVLEYLVQSQKSLSKVELWQDGQLIDAPKLPVAKAGIITNLQRQAPIRLRPGLNRFQLFAENGDGLQSQSLTINHVPSPVVLQLDALVPVDGVTKENLLVKRADGSWGSSTPMDASRHNLKGRVRWNTSNPQALQNARLQVWVAVNGFKQPIRLQPPTPDSLERTFSCPIQLFRDQNVIDVTAPGLPEMANLKATARIDCQSPETVRQRLHLLIVGVGVPKAEELSLIREAVASLSGRQIEKLQDRNEFKFQSPAFADCFGYALTGASLNREKIETAMELIRLAILRAPVNDVLLLYYRGGEQVYNDGQFYLTTQATNRETELQILRSPLQLKNFAVDSGELSTYVSTYPGTQLLLLDVSRTRNSTETQNSTPDMIPGAATFRYAWLKGATIPTDARLISAWQTAHKARLELIEHSLASQHLQLTQRYQNAVSYENYIPEVLRDLVIGTTE